MAPLVSMDGVEFRYGSQPILRDISLSVQPGTMLGLIGPNGGGKTTLIRLLLGLLAPSAGSIEIAGLAPRRAIARGDLVGYLPQNPDIPARAPINVRQTIELGLVGKTGLFKAIHRDDLAFVQSLIDRVGVRSVCEKPIGSLSGGQLQRVFIARALAPRPKLLLLDEPTTGIDRAGQQQFIEFILSLKKEFGLTVIVVSHDLRAISATCDRIACLNQTLHYHDVPDHLPADLVYQMFACDLEAMGIKGGHVCTHGAEPHTHEHPVSIAAPAPN